MTFAWWKGPTQVDGLNSRTLAHTIPTVSSYHWNFCYIFLSFTFNFILIWFWNQLLADALIRVLKICPNNLDTMKISQYITLTYKFQQNPLSKLWWPCICNVNRHDTWFTQFLSAFFLPRKVYQHIVLCLWLFWLTDHLLQTV